MPILEVDYTYTVTSPQRGRRKARTMPILARMPVEIPEADTVSAPVVAVVRVPTGIATDLSRVYTSETTLRRFGDRFVLPYDGQVRADGLPGFKGVGLGYVPDHGLLAHPGTRGMDLSEVRWREVIDDGETVRASIIEKAAAMCVFEGRLWLPHEEPVWVVRPFSFQNELLRVEVMPTYDPIPVSNLATFRIDRGDDAAEHGRWMAARLGCELAILGGAEIHDMAPFRFDALRDHGMRVFRWIPEMTEAGRPPGATGAFLEAYDGLRRIAPFASEGDPTAICEGFDRIRDVIAAAPVKGIGHHWLDRSLRNWELDLRAHETHDAERRRSVEADVSALLAL